jgi:hypothetical protein
MPYQKLLEQIQSLPPEEQKILVSDILNKLKDNEANEIDNLKPRILGLHAGSTVYVAEDFDDELPNSFWLGEE